MGLLTRARAAVVAAAVMGGVLSSCGNSPQEELEWSLSESVTVGDYELVERVREKVVLALYVGRPVDDLLPDVVVPGAQVEPLSGRRLPGDPMDYVAVARFTEPGGQFCSITFSKLGEGKTPFLTGSLATIFYERLLAGRWI
ncbi:hypothetical protein ACFQV2_34455 [Actinokineospora soli]|uniref:Lipoprotein n=1 Tax=Actinokineospora soli TaxID=1048753 RepID=A0ABW2TXX2_9PSEU